MGTHTLHGLLSARLSRRQGTGDQVRDYYLLNQRVYGALAGYYDAVVFPFRALRRRVATLLALPPSARVLDVATGTGEQALALAPAAGEVVGVDLSEAMLEKARRKNRFPNVTFQCADATALPFADQSFDAACVSFALHEMPPGVREKVVREMVRVTRPGGTVAVVDYALPASGLGRWLGFRLVRAYEGPPYVDFVHLDLAAWLKRAGLEVASQLPALRGQATIVVAHRPIGSSQP